MLRWYFHLAFTLSLSTGSAPPSPDITKLSHSLSCQDCRTLMLLKDCLRQWMTELGAHRCRFRTVSFWNSDDKPPLMEFCQPDFTCVVIHLQDQRWAGSISVAAERQELPQVPRERKCPVSKKEMWYLAVQGWPPLPTCPTVKVEDGRWAWMSQPRETNEAFWILLFVSQAREATA